VTSAADLLGREEALEHWSELVYLGEADRETHGPLRRTLRDLTSPEMRFGLGECDQRPCVLGLDGEWLVSFSPTIAGEDGAEPAIVYRSIALGQACALRIKSWVEAPLRGDETCRTWTVMGPV
jgi:hypothetical protein